MEPRGRGRARGQARGQTSGQQAQRPGQGGPPRQPPPQRQPGPPPQGAWGQRPPALVQTQTAPAGAWGLGRPQVAQVQGPSAQTVGRGSRQGDDGSVHAYPEQTTGTKVVAGAGAPGGDCARGGNGGVRGRTNRSEIFVTRPTDCKSKKGEAGRKITLMANFFKLVQAGKWTLRQYRVDFSVELDDTRVKRRLMYQALLDEKTVGGYLFDGTVLYTPHILNPEPMEKFVATDNGENIRITIRFITEVAWGDYHYLQVFNIVIRKCLIELKLQLVGRNYFDPQANIKLGEYNLDLWPGYYTSIRQHEQSILMNADIQFKVMRLDSVFDTLMDCRSSNIRSEFQNKVIGSVVLTTYNNKTYRVDDVDFNATPMHTFKKRDGTEISYLQHFKDRYNARIVHKDQPMLVSKSKPREIRAGMPEIVYLVPELCRMTGLSERQRDNFKLMRALADVSRVGPKDRIDKLIRFSKRLTSNQGVMKELNRWDLKFAETLVKFEGRVLPPESIVFGNKAKYPVEDADWTKNLRSNAMFTAEQISRLAVICPAKLKQPCQEFMQTLKKAASGMNKWDIGQYRIFETRDDRSATYLEQIEQIINTANPTLIMCILPTATSDRYSAIKKKCCVDRGIPTQIILARSLTNKGVMSIATKVAIQLNCKIGGAPWTVVMPLANLMVVGYDVCRDTANKSKSFAGMVASLDKQITRYFSAVSEHKYEEELSENFASFIIVACKKYFETSGCFPERILIYRDGVGDGQIPYVHSHEVSNIKKRLQEEIYKNNNVKLAFVVVSKRINTKIFHEGQNPPPGTVVDDVITLPERYDFFIVSQCVRQGTVGPTSYNVIEDTMGLPPDRMQMLTYKLTHMYYNWSGTVRVPAPCQYAHKLAFLVSQSLHRPAHRNLENVLYYL